MAENLTAGIVRILKLDGTTAGTGFVATDDGLIATCAHVAQSAGAGPGDTVRVVFHAAGEEREAHIERSWWREPNAEDVAILRIDGLLPEAVRPLLLGSSGASKGHEFSSRGYRLAEHFSRGLETGGRIQATDVEYKGYPGLQLLTNQIDEGMSGAPIWDLQSRRVVGMVNFFWETKRHIDAWLAFATPTETLRAICSELQLSDLCPYRGLAAFAEADAEFFFGREKLVDKLVDQLRGSPRFLAVVGPSGSGKSSIVQAGLFPALRRGKVSGSESWHILSFRPSDDPFAALAAAGPCVQQGDDLQVQVQAFLQAHPQANRLVLFADQFEELFALCSEPVQEQFLEQLQSLLENNLPVTVLLTLRADFYGHLLRNQSLVDWLEVGQVNVSPMGLEELQAVVEEPALKLGLSFEPGLAKTIAEDAGKVDHPLPLLESALMQLWEKREDGTLTHAAYQIVGKVAGAIGQWAEDAYNELSSKDRLLAQHIFTRLVHYGEGEIVDTRRRCAVSELVAQPEDEEKAHRLVRRLADIRLLVTGEKTGIGTVEIIHDALLQKWSRLKQWMTKQREFLLWRQRLGERVQDWIDKKQDKGALLRGALLAEARRWLVDHADDLSKIEWQFIDASLEDYIQDRRKAATDDLASQAIGALHGINNISGLGIAKARQIEHSRDATKCNDEYCQRRFTELGRTIEEINEIAQRFMGLVSNRSVLKRHNIRTCIDNAIKKLEFVLQRESVEIDVAPGFDDRFVYGPPNLEDVFDNLIRNSVEAMRDSKEKRITIGLVSKASKHLLILSVSDTGPGVDSQIRAHLFSFGATTKVGEAGIGLWWVKTFLQRIGGDILYDTSYTGGAHFLIELLCD